ncbi:MAG: DUF1549 domain-containing protein [Pirellulaceae bacterium]
MRSVNRLLICPLLLLVLPGASGAEPALLPPDLPPEQAIDHYLDTRLQQVGISSAPPVDDANYLRRVMLDLVGRPPTAAEARAFLALPDTDKRIRLVDRLIASSAYARHQAAEFDAWLMDDTRSSIRDYLVKAFRERRTWDQMFRDMIVGEPDDVRQQGAVRYVAARSRDLDQLASDTSVAFFGVNVTCAKCHDHPLVDDWKQDHYFGMLSFFSRTFNAGEFFGERDYGQLTFKTVEGETRDARLMFLNGALIPEAPSPEPDDRAKREEKQRLEMLKQKKEPPPPPSYSRRAALVDAALRDQEQAFFSRAIVNHLWSRLFGHGLVTPIDQMHSENQPSHPELLEWLARDMRRGGYDLTRFIRSVVLSRAYARSSRWDSALPRPNPSLFAVAQVRPLKPWQYAMLLRLGATSPDDLPAETASDAFDQRMTALEQGTRNLAKGFDMPGEDFQVGVAEALWLSNGTEIADSLLADQPATLVGRLGRCDTPEAAAELAIWNVFARPPEEGEVSTLVDYLAARADRGPQARRQLVWALLTSSESRFNY